MISFLKKELPFLLTGVAILAFCLYFSFFTILRNEKLYAHYFDLGIMHQTVYNTYMSLKTGDMSRFLELTNPHGGIDQVKRMMVHNDILLAVLAPFYFVNPGPETLLVIQTLVVAFGALFIFLIAEEVFQTKKAKDLSLVAWLPCIFSVAYLLYPPTQKATVFEFHAVTLAMTFVLGMWFFWMKKRYWWSLLFAGLVLLTKEQVGMTTAFFGLYVIYKRLVVIPNLFRDLWPKMLKQVQHDKEFQFGLLIGVISIIWVALSMFVIIPMSRVGDHFAAEYYDYLIADPLQIFPVIFRGETFQYFSVILGPLGYFSLLSPLILLISLPEFALILLSDNGNMRNIYFHYHTVLTAFVFISAMYGARLLSQDVIPNLFRDLWPKMLKQVQHDSLKYIVLILIISTIYSSYIMSSMPWARQPDTGVFTSSPVMIDDMQYWRQYLKDENLKISATGHLAPHFTSRRYFYDFSLNYPKADYILIDTDEVRNGYLKEKTIPAYDALLNDPKYIKIYDNDGLQVFKKL